MNVMRPQNVIFRSKEFRCRVSRLSAGDGSGPTAQHGCLPESISKAF